MASASVNGIELPAFDFHDLHETEDGLYHGSFYVRDLGHTLEGTRGKEGQFLAKIVHQLNGVELPLLGQSVAVEEGGKVYAGKVVAVSGQRVEWEGA